MAAAAMSAAAVAQGLSVQTEPDQNDTGPTPASRQNAPATSKPVLEKSSGASTRLNLSACAGVEYNDNIFTTNRQPYSPFLHAPESLSCLL
ncbi:MAG: hypothetical protein ACI9V0_003283 [Parasphingorhabdus sp.]|jgi:hypothetical protein